MANAALGSSLNATIVVGSVSFKRLSRKLAPTTGSVTFSGQGECHHRKNITLRDYMLIVTSHTVGRRSDPKDRRDTTLLRLRIQKILRPRPQRTVSLSVSN